MYAVRRLHVKQWDHEPAEERYSVQVAHGGKPVPGIQPERITDVEEEVMYWRKANHIHAWFVDNVQDGEDDCDPHHVSWEQLRALLSICKKVIKASELVDGMICASTVYDQEHPEGLAQREPGKVIKDATVARELLPTRPGFFFGSAEYDKGYLDDVVGIRMHRRSRSWKALPRPPLLREACILTDCSRIAVRPGARRNNRTVLDLNYAR